MARRVVGWASPAPVYLAATIFTLLAVAVPANTSALARMLRVLTAVLLVILVIVHASAYGFEGDGAARVVDCVLGFTAMILLLSAIPLPRFHTPEL